jgi:hypothetical protein
MTAMETAYIVGVIVGFAAFALVLGYTSQQYERNRK